MAVMGVIGPADRAARMAALADDLKLTNKQRTFAEALAATGNQAEAGRVAALGKNPDVQASKMVRVPKVAAYLAALKAEAVQLAQQRTKRRIMGGAEVLERLTEQAEISLAEFVTIVPDAPSPTAGPGDQKPAKTIDDEKRDRGWYIDIPKALEAGLGHLIQEISYDKQGLPRLKLPDRQGALDKLARYHGHYKGEEGGAQVTNVLLLQVLQSDPKLGAGLMKALLSGQPKEVEGGRLG
jgi:hypothetical protein